jgi:hypothetical protein
MLRMSVPMEKSFLFTWGFLAFFQKDTECVDDRDRLYSVLGLIENERDLAVNYEEEPAELFWRAGEHFQIWAKLENNCLQSALRLDRVDLRGSLKCNRKRRLTIRMQHAYYERPGPRKKFLCKQHDKLIPCMSQHEVLLCTREDDSTKLENHPSAHSHVLLKRCLKSARGIAVTLVPGSMIDITKAELNDAMLQTCEKRPSTASAIGSVSEDSCAYQRSSEDLIEMNKWVTMNNWELLMERLAIQNSDMLSGKWRLSLLARDWLNYSYNA